MTEQQTLPMWLIKQRQALFEKNVPKILHEFREHHWQTFLQTGLPHISHERWKYADLNFLQKAFITAEPNTHDDIEAIISEYRLEHPDALIVVILNGRYEPSYSDMAKLPKEVSIHSWQNALEPYLNFINQHKHDYAFAQLNAALSQDGLFIEVREDYQLKQSLHIVSLAGGAHTFHPSHCILLGKGAKLTVIEHHQSITAHEYLLNTVLHVHVGEGARFSRYKLQQENSQVCHIGHTFIRQEKDSEVSAYSFSLGSHFSRDELNIALCGEGANVKTTGFYVSKKEDQYLDHHVDIHHHAPHTESDMYYKGIVQHKARAVFNGKLYVDQGAQKITAYQANHNLLLSNRAEVYSKPELEIYADDVKCKHGATIGQLDQEALYYLRSRGIADDEAIIMLLKGFAAEILERIHLPDIKRQLQQMVIL